MNKKISGLKTKKRNAFTVIELMVVVVIIAILATMVLVTLEKGKIKSRDAKRKADLALFSGSLERYRADTKAYPRSNLGDDGWCSIASSSSYACFINLPTSFDFKNYLSPLPTDPNGTNMYKYNSSGSEYKLIIKSEGITDAEAAIDTPCNNLAIKQKAGDNCNPVDASYFQISSSNDALNW